MKLKVFSVDCGMMSCQCNEHVTINLLPYKVSHQKIGDSPFGPLENMADKEVVLMFERMPFLRTCNIFDGRYFIWKTDQCRLFTCVTCIDACLFADTEK